MKFFILFILLVSASTFAASPVEKWDQILQDPNIPKEFKEKIKKSKEEYLRLTGEVEKTTRYKKVKKFKYIL